MNKELSTVVIAFTGKKAIEQAIAAISVRGKELDDAIQLTGLSVLHHIDAYGDVTVAKGLYDALPKGARKNALVEWMLRFGKVALNTDKKTAKDLPFLFDKTRTTDLPGAQGMPWYNFKPEQDPITAFDFQAALAALLNKAAAAETKGLSIEGAEMLAKVRALA